MARAEVLVAEVHEELARVSVRVAEIREELTRIATERAEYLARAEVLARDAVVLSSNRDLARVLETLDVFASRSSTFREVGWQSMMSRARNAATDTDEFDSLVEQLLEWGLIWNVLQGLSLISVYQVRRFSILTWSSTR
jgi:hypothetical protein